MKRILPYFLFLANVVLVFLVAWALGFDIFRAVNRNHLYVYLGIAMLLYGIENWLFDRIRAKVRGGSQRNEKL